MNKLEKSEHFCNFCKKNFIKENALLNHICVKKQRWLDKDTKWSVLGFYAYQRFYQLTRASGKKVITMNDFIDSRYYGDFIKLGRFLTNHSIIKSSSYIDYLIKNSIKLKDWCNDYIYERYIKEVINSEDPTSGIERSIEYLMDWANENNRKMQDFYEYSNTYVSVNAIRSGKISPWLIYLAPRSNILLDRFDDGQIKLLQEFLDPKVWQIKKTRYKKECESLKRLLNEYEL